MNVPHLHDWPATEAEAAFAAVVVLRAGDLSVVEESVVTCEVTFPYIPGLLSFREIPARLAAFAELRQPPDAVMLHGQGILCSEPGSHDPGYRRSPFQG